MLTTRQAAEKIGVTPGRIHQLIQAGVIKAQRYGQIWLIQETDLEQSKWCRKPGKKKKDSMSTS